MTTSASTLRWWAAAAFPQHHWDEATSHHGAFHDVVLTTDGVALRIVIGEDASRRAHREVATWGAVQDVALGVVVPRVLSDVVAVGDRIGYLTSAAPGASDSSLEWSQVSGALTELRAAMSAAPSDLLLPPPRQWCGGPRFPYVVEHHLASSLGPHLRAALEVVRALQELPAPKRPVLVHGDFGTHNVLWRQGRAVALIDWDHACVDDPAIDVAPLIGAYGAAAVCEVVPAGVVERGMVHRATLPLQVAAAAALAGRMDLRDHAVGNFIERLAAGTLHDPEGAVPNRT